MPIYEYRCPECGKTESILCKYEEDDHDCPVCESKMKRQLSAPHGRVRKGVYEEFGV